MPTYVLEGTGRAVFPRRPVVITVTVTGPTPTASVHALVGGVDDARAVRPAPGLMVLPRIDSLTIVRISPAHGASVFADGTSIHVSLAAEDRSDPDVDRAVIGPLDVSGATHVDVASLDSAQDGVAVVGMRSRPDVNLGTVGNRARSVARVALGVDQMPDSARMELVVAIDMSASMLLALRSGALAAVCDIIAGIAGVVSPSSVPRVCLVDATPRWVDVRGAETFSDDVVADVERSAVIAGFSSALVPADDRVESSTTLIVTDDLPADRAPRPGMHYLVITDSATVSELAGLRDVTGVPEPDGEIPDFYAQSREVVEAIVTSLVRKQLGRVGTATGIGA